jgi:antitoxin PrlF
MPTATITSKGQVTVPKKVREALKVGPGDQIDFVVQDDGQVSVRPVQIDVTELRGLLHRSHMRPVNLDEMDAAIARAHARRR